jgi:hypothetical protein
MGTRGVAALDLPSGRVTDLGRAETFVPSQRDHTIWLISDRRVATHVDVRGGRIGPEVTLPTATSVIGAIGDVLLLQGKGGPLIWSASHRRTIRRFDADDEFIAASAQQFVIAGLCRVITRPPDSYSGCGRIKTFDLRTLRERWIPARRPADALGWVSTVGQGSHENTSPDASHVAVYELHPRSRNGVITVAARLVVIDVQDGSSIVVPRSDAADPASHVAWSSDSRWLFFATDGRVGAFDLRSRVVRTYRVTCCGAAMFTMPT